MKQIHRQHSVFVANHGGAIHHRNVGQLLQWNLTPHRRHDQHAFQLIEVLAQIARVTQVDRVPLATFDGGGNRLAANSRHDDVLDVVDGETVPRNRFAPRCDVHEIAASDALGENAARARHIAKNALDAFADTLDFVEVGSKDLHADRCANSRGEHVDAILDRHCPGVDAAGNLHGAVHFVDEFLLRNVFGPDAAQHRAQGPRPRGKEPLFRRPLGHRLELHNRFHHRERRGIGRCVGPARLAVDRNDLGEPLQDAILRFHQPLRLGHGDAGECGRHVQDRSLVQRRHEFVTELQVDGDGRGHDDRCQRNGCLRMTQHESTWPLVQPEQHATDGVFLLGVIFPDKYAVHQSCEPTRPHFERLHPREQHAHRRIKRDGQQRRQAYRQRFCVRQRFEESAFLIDKGEHRQKRHRNHQQREEDRRPDLHQGFQANLVKIALSTFFLPAFEFFVGVLDLDNRAVHEHADGNRNPGKAHDV